MFPIFWKKIPQNIPLIALSTQNLRRRLHIIYEVCVLDHNRTNFSMMMRGSILGNLAKPFSDCVTVLCLGQCKSTHLKVCGIMIRTCYFQTNWISYIFNWDVRCLCCWWHWFHVLFWASHNYPQLNWRTFLTGVHGPGFHNHTLGYRDRGPKSYPWLRKMCQNQTLDNRKCHQVNHFWSNCA